jgi:hypothetical protein
VSRATSASDVPVLDAVALGRATLARQLLLDPAHVDPPADVPGAISALGGLQAQEPGSPYLALWARLPGFAAVDLDGALARRDVVKASLMRATLHVVAATDYLALQPAVAPILQGFRRQDRDEPPDDATLARIGEVMAARASEPRSLPELRQILAESETGIVSGFGAGGRDGDGDGDRSSGRGEDVERVAPDVLFWWMLRAVPFIRAPTHGLSWSFGRRPRLVIASAWLSGHSLEPDLRASLRALVRRHLAAFGPATAADIAAWSGVPVGRLRPAIDDLDADGALWHARDERGRALMDLPDAPRPEAGTPAPPRLLPMWDSILLAHQDRTRIISDADRRLVVARNGDTLPTLLVDGRVAGLWWADEGPGGRTHIAIEPFRPIAPLDRRRLEADGERLATFVGPHEPAIYARYQRWRVR